jgi:hypothetical protein
LLRRFEPSRRPIFSEAAQRRNALRLLRPTRYALTISYDLAAVQKKRILEGERADVIILTRVMMDDLAKQNKLAPGNIVKVARTPVALAARAGAPKPNISTADAFKQTLLSAKSISYADPAKGGLSGVVAGRAIDRLGIAEQMKHVETAMSVLHSLKPQQPSVAISEVNSAH